MEKSFVIYLRSISIRANQGASKEQDQELSDELKRLIEAKTKQIVADLSAASGRPLKVTFI